MLQGSLGRCMMMLPAEAETVLRCLFLKKSFFFMITQLWKQERPWKRETTFLNSKDRVD
jgi:hypothetical protein